MKDRRQFIKHAGGVAAGAAVAGCLGGDDDDDSGNGNGNGNGQTGNGDASAWPPSNGLVEFVLPQTAGSTTNNLVRTWTEYMEGHYEDDILTSVTVRPSGQGLESANTVYGAEPDGSTLLVQTIIDLMLPQLESPDLAEYDVAEFAPIGAWLQDTRGLQVSHHSTPVEEHWEWDWDTLVDHILDNDWVWATSVGTQQLFAEMVIELEPRLSHDEINVVNFPGGGSEIRAASMREEIHLYGGGFGSNYPRDDYYKTQFVLADDNFPTLIERAENTDPDYVTLAGGGFPEEEASDIVSLIVDTALVLAPPETPSDIVDVHQQAIRNTAENEEDLEELIEDIAGEHTFMASLHSEDEDYTELLVNTREAFEEYEDLLPDFE